MDKGIEYQQNWKVMALGFIIVSARTTRYVDVVPLMPQVTAVLSYIQAGQLIHVP